LQREDITHPVNFEYLGLPWHRLKGFQALVGVPVPDATPWDQGEIVGDWTHPIFKWVEKEAAQGEVIFQDDTPGRVLALIEENQQARARAQAQGKAQTTERTGMQTTALIVQVGARRIGLYYTGRRHAGENLEQLLTKREPGRGKPLVMSDALSHNHAEEATLMRGHCLAHGRRQFTALADDFPSEGAAVVDALKLVYDHDKQAHAQQLSAQERLVYHQTYSEPVFRALKTCLEQQPAPRLVEPNSSFGKAFAYRLEHWETLTRVLKEPGAPLDNNIAERAVKLAIRQRQNSLFYATEHSAYIASILTRVIATWVQAGVHALDYLVALQEHRQEGFATPSAWLPWNYQAALVPSYRTGRHLGASCTRSGWPLPKSTFSSHAESVTLAVVAVGHQEKRRWERRLVQSQKPWPSYARSFSAVPVRLRKT